MSVYVLDAHLGVTEKEQAKCGSVSHLAFIDSQLIIDWELMRVSESVSERASDQTSPLLSKAR